MANSNPGNEGPRGVKFDSPDQIQFKMRDAQTIQANNQGAEFVPPEEAHQHQHNHHPPQGDNFQQQQHRYEQAGGVGGGNYQQPRAQPGFQWVRGQDGNVYQIPIGAAGAVVTKGLSYKLLPWIFAIILLILLVLLARIYLMRGWAWFRHWAASGETGENYKLKRSPSTERRRNSPRIRGTDERH